ncbi:MAG: AI-2E family transporter [Hyphomicrobium sp.]|nr:AI-2E family transporter [Hyphomicrobium sp.]
MPNTDQPAQRPASPEDARQPVPQGALTKVFLIAGLLLSVVVLLVYGAGVLVPLAVALLLWFFINALANGYQRLWSRWLGPLRGLSLVLALLTMLAASLFAMSVVITNVTAIGASSADFANSLNLLLNKVAAYTGLKHEELLKGIANQLGLGQLLASIVSAMTNFASQFGVVFIYVIFLLVEQQFFNIKLNAIVRNEARREQVRALLDRMGRDIQSYILIMTFVSTLTAILSYGVMVAVDLEHAAFWAFLIFILNFIPTIGSIIGTALPSLYGLLQFGDFKPFLILLAAIGVIQFLIGNILQPRLSAKTLNLSQFVVILSLFVWGAMWGIVGMFLAVPITAILVIVFANFPSTRVLAAVLSESGDVPAPANLTIEDGA